jgi:hypothetical protein
VVSVSCGYIPTQLSSAIRNTAIAVSLRVFMGEFQSNGSMGWPPRTAKGKMSAKAKDVMP